MRNLINVRHFHTTLKNSRLPLKATAWDPSTNDTICAFGPSETTPTVELRLFPDNGSSYDDTHLIASWDALSPLPDLACERILLLHYFADTATSCLILAGGDLVVVRHEPLPGQDQIEIVGSVDVGITAAAWSPDEELLAITTRADTLIYMTRDFESVTDAVFSPEDVQASAHVSVGWGKSETQFKGKRAKALRDPTVPEHVDEGILSDQDRGETTISWRGDGAYLAVNKVEAGQRRMIRVFSRDGALDGVSEPVDRLDQALCWRPAGNLMAGIQRRPDRIDVVLFERNGLRHGQFTLRETDPDVTQAIDLAWNSDSSVLAVAFMDRVQLWTMGNYHYYLKQEIKLEHGTHPMKVRWHSEEPLRLALSTDASLLRLSFALDVAHGSTCPPNDTGIVAVVDGCQLKITPLRLANVPPPMAYMELTLNANVIHVAFDKTGSKLAILAAAYVRIYSLDLSNQTQPQLISTIPTHHGIDRQVAFVDDDTIAVLSSAPDNHNDCISVHHGQNSVVLKVLDRPCVSLFPRTDHDRIQIADDRGHISELFLDEYAVFLRPLAALSKPCLRNEVWFSGTHTLCFGLTPSGTLHATRCPATGSEVALEIRNVTSFLITPVHLIFTTRNHLLKFVHLHSGDLEVPADEPEKDERCRSIERGARLVTAMPSAYSVVLQMPRGNLETIFPRALVLAGIRKSLLDQDYKRAFLACRNQRVDMNIIHDFAPEQFLRNVALFVKQVKKVEHIDLFLSQLREENVAETLYKDTLTVAGPEVNGDAAKESPIIDTTLSARKGKVNRICDAFLVALQDRASTHIQNTVTAHVCKVPPDLEAGLSLVAKLRDENPEMVDRAIEHICFLVDVNRLYDTALGLYDLDVALLIAQQSQKDPREYLPYLQKLQELPQLRRRFTVDHDLKRHDRALAQLHALGEFDELKTYMNSHGLYTTAIELYRYQTQRLNEIMRIYADFLSDKSRFRDAGVAYEFLQEYGLASKAYQSANMWQQCLACANLSGASDEGVRSLAGTLAEALTESKDYAAAAAIHLDYLSDVDNASRLFCRGHLYADAIRVLSLHRRRDLLTTVIDPLLIEGSASTTETLAEMKTQLSNQVPRLRELRVKKNQDPLAYLLGTQGPGDADIPDDISLAASSTASTMPSALLTQYTNISQSQLSSARTGASRRTSSKTRRREERKRARGKKGSVYEEEYLVNSVGRLIERYNRLGDDVERLVEGLMRRAMRERALAVATAYEEVGSMCESVKDEVFETATTDDKDPNEQNRPAGGEGVFWDATQSNGRIRDPPVVVKFKRMSLLD